MMGSHSEHLLAVRDLKLAYGGIGAVKGINFYVDRGVPALFISMETLLAVDRLMSWLSLEWA